MKNKQTEKNKIILWLAILLIAVGVISLLYVGNYYLKGYRLKNDNKKLAESFHETEVLSQNSSSDKVTASVENETSQDYQKKLDELANDNPDIIGWIYIEGTSIDYPVVHHSDNDYYLSHDFTNKADKHGSIFMDSRNDWSSDNEKWIIYGHNMKDMTMFAPLRYYKDKTFMEEHNKIIFYNKNAIYEFTIDEARIWNGEDDGSYDIEAMEKGEILLSTCDANDSRLIVHGKLN